MYKKLLCLLCAFGFLANGYATEPAQAENKSVEAQEVVSNDDVASTDDSVASNDCEAEAN